MATRGVHRAWRRLATPHRRPGSPAGSPSVRALAGLGVAAALALYVAWLVFAYRYHFLDGVNLLVHEAGHVFFGFFGEVLGRLGGTLLQLLFPIAFVAYFARWGQRFEAAVCGVWAAESAMYTAEYIADAQLRALPLVGGHIHDWHWLLSRAGILGWCEEIGLGLHLLASVVAIACVWLVAREAREW